MIKATLLGKASSTTLLQDENGKQITICSSGEPSAYLSPRQLVQGGIAGCMAMTLRSALAREGVAYEDVSVSVEMTRDGEATVFQYAMEVTGASDAEGVERAKQATASGCFIKNLLLGEVRIEEAEVESGSSGDCCCGVNAGRKKPKGDADEILD